MITLGRNKQLILLERGIKLFITKKFLREKFAGVETFIEEDVALMAFEVGIVGKALGETLDTISFPKNWDRLLKRKDCPKYMKEMQITKVNAYYPKLSLPEEDNWVAIDNGGVFKYENSDG